MRRIKRCTRKYWCLWMDQRFLKASFPMPVRFATALNIPVHLLQVIDPETRIPSVAAQQDRSNNILTGEREHNGDYLKEISTSFPDPAAVSCLVRIGKAAEVITEVAAPHLDTLIAMTTHGRSGVRRWLLGSVAEKVLHGFNSNDRGNREKGSGSALGTTRSSFGRIQTRRAGGTMRSRAGQKNESGTYSTAGLSHAGSGLSHR